MTGSSVRNHGFSPNNDRGSLVKDFLLSASRRMSISALNVSVFNASRPRSHENIALNSPKETVLIEHESPYATLLANKMDPPGRLRTCSLTMDVSCHNRKDIDSGNSSLIDSSSADSYQEFGCGSRSRTTSSSKSDQSLTSVNQNDYQMGCHRKRHSSVSDSFSGSSGKVSLNTSDITETSEESLASDKDKENNAVSSSYYVRKDKYSESESQPFLYLPHVSSFHSSKGDEKYRSGIDAQDTASSDDYDEYTANEDPGVFPASSDFNISTIAICDETSPLTSNTYFRNREQRLSIKYSFGEDNPLLGDYEKKLEKNECILLTFRPEISKVPLRRSASVGNISKIHTDSLKASLVSERLDSIPSCSPRSAVNPNTMASLTSYDHHHKKVVDVKSFHVFNNRSYRSFRPYPSIKLASPQGTADQPCPGICHNSHTQLESSSIVATTALQQPQHFPAATQGQLCSNYMCSSPCIMNNQHGHSKDSDLSEKASKVYNSACASAQDAFTLGPSFISSDSCQPTPDTDTSACSTIKNVVQNLESVLGHGAPVSVSVLKHGFKSLKSKNGHPLQVLVPRLKSAAHEINPMCVTANMDVSCQEKAYLEAKELFLQHDPQRRSRKTSPKEYHRVALSAKHFPNAQSNLRHMNTILQDRAEYSPDKLLNCDEHGIFFGDKVREDNSLHLNNINVSKDMRQTLIQGNYTDINRRTDNLELAVVGTLGNSNLINPGSNSLPFLKANKIYQKETIKLNVRPYGECEMNPISSQINNTKRGVCHIKSKRKNSPETDASCTSQLQIHKTTKSTHGEQETARYSYIVPSISPGPHLTTCCAARESAVSDQHPTISLDDLPYQKCHLNGDELDVSSKDTLNDDSNINQAPVDDNGYRANMVLRIPKSCIVADFLDYRKSLNNARVSTCHSLTTRTEGRQDVNGSLQRLKTDQQVLLKTGTGTPGRHEYFNRDVPDYKFLCLVATILNPLFGLVALICNHYAQRNLRLHRRAHANNLYFATIVFSTLAIFLTLISGALLIAHTIVLQTENTEYLSSPSADDCQGRLFAYDENMMKFFKIDFILYCEITKNEKVMEALNNFWTVDKYNRETKKTQIKNNPGNASFMAWDKDRRNSTTEDTNETQNGNEYFALEKTLNITALPERMTAVQDASRVHLNTSDVPRPARSFSKAIDSNNSVARSADDPLAPAGVEGRYKTFGVGLQQPQLSDTGNDELQKIVSEDMSSDISSQDGANDITTVSNAKIRGGNITAESA